MSFTLDLMVSQRRFKVNRNKSYDLSIPIHFNSPDQPNHFGAPIATSAPLQVPGFIGDTEQGGSCNVALLSMVPQCNGTHIENLSHVLSQKVSIYESNPRGLYLALLLSVEPERRMDCAGEFSSDYVACKEEMAKVISLQSINKFKEVIESLPFEAIVFRTLPNLTHKMTFQYQKNSDYPYMTTELLAYLRSQRINHLLVDTPSIDAMYDEGKLINHRVFMGMSDERKGNDDINPCARTVSEMIFVPEAATDGSYLLDLQMPAFSLDAAPCRPIIYQLEEINK